MLSSYLGGRTRDLHLDNVTMKLVALLCHLSTIYTLLDRQTGLQEGTQQTGTLLQFKLAAKSWLFEHASHRVSGRHYVTHYARLERENCSHPERAYDYSALYGETSHIREIWILDLY